MQERSSLVRWQFLTITVDYNSNLAQVNGQVRPAGDVNLLLDEYGREGWELVSVVQNSLQPNLWGFFFKRSL